MKIDRFALAGLLAFLGVVGGIGAARSDQASTADSAWLALPRAPGVPLSDPLEQRGRDVFDQRCAACHGAIPEQVFGGVFLPPMPGTQALQARYRGALPALLEERTDLTRAFVAAVVRGGLPAMPFFRPTEVSDDDLAAVAAYLTRER